MTTARDIIEDIRDSERGAAIWPAEQLEGGDPFEVQKEVVEAFADGTVLLSGGASPDALSFSWKPGVKA